MAWTIASHPPLTLTPSCNGASIERADLHTKETRHFETSRHIASPIAMGQRPPLFFLHAKRVAPQRRDRTKGRVFQAARRLTNLISEESTRQALS